MVLKPEDTIRHLKGLVKGEVLYGKLAGSLYATDASIYRRMPLCAVRVRDAGDVASVVKYCASEGIPLAPRGAGTGVAGESLTTGIVLDFHPYMQGIGGMGEGEIWVEPGVVPAVLNRHLHPYGLLFGPDPATSDRCTVGGMVGNDATGSHSLVYGDTRAKVKALEVVYGDGRPSLLEPVALRAGQVAPEADGVIRKLGKLALKAKDCELPFAQTLKRNRHGYTLWKVVGDRWIDPTQVVVGSEGTLCVVTRAKLALDKIPGARGLAVVKFKARSEAFRVLPRVLELKPASVEFIDDVLLGLARSVREYGPLISGDADCWLMVTFEGNEGAVRERLSTAEAAFGKLSTVAELETTMDSQRQSFFTGMREAAVPLLYRRSDGFLPLALVEDTAVPPERLGEYVAEVEKIFSESGVEATFYGHAGPGELHIRPFIRPWQQAHLMPEIASRVFECALRFGGTASGEHGDGILRSFFVRRQYGEDLWRLFKQTKETFDPEGILNPGKKIVEEDRLPLDGLRYLPGNRTYGVDFPPAELSFSRDELARVAFACTGCGSCRTTKQEKRMCPVFRAMQVEEASPRAKANLLREVKAGDVSYEAGVGRVLDLCLWCRSCGRECPSALSIPEAILEMRAGEAQSKGLGLEKRAMCSLAAITRVGAIFPRTYNFFQNRKLLRSVSEFLLGIDGSKPAPAVSRRRLTKDSVVEVPPIPGGKQGVAYFADIYADFFDPALGRKVISVLREAGCFPVLPKQEPCGIVPLVYGAVKTARKIAERNVERLLPFVEAGYLVVVSEPTAALMLRNDYRRLLHADSPVFQRTFELGSLLYGRWKEGRFEPHLAVDKNKKLAYHRPCHLFESGRQDPGFRELLKEPLGFALNSLPESCCGMGGTFGMRRRNRDLSRKIGSELFDSVNKEGFEGFVTECSSCKMQIEAESKVKGYHPVELIQ